MCSQPFFMVSKRVQNPVQNPNHLEFRYGSERRRIYFPLYVLREVTTDHGGEGRGEGEAGGGGAQLIFVNFKLSYS